MFDGHPRDRFLYKHELDALARALDETPDLDLVHFVKLALTTWARKSDIFSMRWSDVELDAAQWIVRHSKSRSPYRVALIAQTVEILRGRFAMHGAGAWVFRNPTAFFWAVKKITG